ncbi:MAG TPA: NADH-quinone oxidoreductase subunit N [Candidatus Methanomethylophilaceae archaeon]|nr:NADH-quinone oxidoreductase subunit N [Candidatus Methanomethylophilaceae archaeon]
MIDIDISFITETFKEVTPVLPMLIMIIGALLMPAIHMFIKNSKVTAGSALVVVILATVVNILLLTGGYTGTYYGMFEYDGFSGLMILLFEVVAFISILVASASRETTAKHVGAFFALMLIATVGMSFVATASDLLMIFIGVEMVSIPSYAMVALKRHDARASEAAVKYVIIGGLSSGLTVYGISMLFGLSGSTNIAEIAGYIGAEGYTAALVIAIVTMIAGYGFKIAAVPFHSWAPDVYEGAATPVTIFLSTGSKKMGLIVFIKIFFVIFVTIQTLQHGLVEGFQYLFAIIAAVTMTIGNIVAIVQKNVKRMLAYSSIAQAGYMLIALAVMSQWALTGTIYYMFVHVFMKAGAFVVVAALITTGVGETLKDYRGLAKRAPLISALMLIFLFSLAGIPPLGGFTAKFFLFSAAIVPVPGGDISFQWIWLAFIAILNSAISLYYYAKVIKAMYIEKGETEERIKIPTTFTVAAILCAIGVILLGVFPEPFLYYCSQAAALIMP